jgi:hypothetical protein
MKIRSALACLPPVLTVCFAMSGSWEPTLAQSLNWEGQTGALMTPFAYVSTSRARSVGRPNVSFHVLDGGEVIGMHYQVSITLGLLNRLEVGVTRSAVSSVGPEPVASLFDRGFTTVHAKLALLREARLRPAVSAGALYHWQKEHIAADIVPSDPTQDADLYLAVTKTLTLSEGVSVVLNGGVRATNASLMGIAGNTPSWEARGFASGGFLLKENVLVGAEFRQQPAHLDGFPEVRIPSTVAYFVRLGPGRAARANLDVGLVRVAGLVAPGLDLKAQDRLAAGVSYRF